MIISIPTEATLASTDVVDYTEHFSTTVQKTWYEEDLVQFNNKKYAAIEDIVVSDYDSTKTDYRIGDVVYQGGSIPNQVMFATEGEIPKAPPQYYPAVDNTVTNLGVDQRDHTNWNYRFMKVNTIGESGDTVYPYEYTVTKPDGYTHNYYFNKVSDSAMYVRLVVKDDTGTTVEYSDATVELTSLISNLTTVAIAITQSVTGSSYDSYFPQYVYENETGVYIRTNKSVAQETVYVKDAMLFKSVTSPEDIKSFSYIEPTVNVLPFDKKNYSKVSKPTSMRYKINISEKSNMFVLGYVRGSSFTYTVKDGGDSTVQTDNVVIDGSRDDSGVLSDWYTTKIIYSTVGTWAAGFTVEVTIYGTPAELGTFMVGAYVDAGMTNLALKNSYKDFSVFEYDPWGNPSYTDRAKVALYSGTVDIPIPDYDRVDRLMMSLGKSIVVIDGSDNVTNAVVEDNDNIFSATQKIGRIMTFSQSTSVKSNDMNPIAVYNISIEEIV